MNNEINEAEREVNIMGEGDTILERGDVAVERVRRLSEMQDVFTTTAGLVEMEFQKDMEGFMKLGESEGVDRIEGYIRISDYSQTGRLTFATRKAMVQKARVYALNDNNVEQIVNLYTNFGVGTGLTVKILDEEKKEHLDTILKFLKAKKNRTMFSVQGQRQLSDDLVTDGEIYFALFAGDDAVKVRTIDPLQVTDIITDPDDEKTVLYYKREWMAGANKTDLKKAYYKDWMNDDNDESMLDKSIPVMDDVVVYQVAFKKSGKWGKSILKNTIQWARALTLFMKARVSIQQALAIFAWKKKIKGGQKAVQAEINRYQSGFVSGDTEDNPPPARGATIVENEGIDTTPIKTDTGAGNAKMDGGMLIRQVGISASIFPQYLGEGDLSTYAVANTMEAPMMKQFEAYQAFWANVYRNLFVYVLELELDEEIDAAIIDIDYPPIVKQDAVAILQAMGQLTMAFPQLVNSDDILQFILTTLNINNPQEVIARLKESYDETTPAHLLLLKLLEKLDAAGKLPKGV